MNLTVSQRVLFILRLNAAKYNRRRVKLIQTRCYARFI